MNQDKGEKEREEDELGTIIHNLWWLLGFHVAKDLAPQIQKWKQGEQASFAFGNGIHVETEMRVDTSS